MRIQSHYRFFLFSFSLSKKVVRLEVLIFLLKIYNPKSAYILINTQHTFSGNFRKLFSFIFQQQIASRPSTRFSNPDSFQVSPEYSPYDVYGGKSSGGQESWNSPSYTPEEKSLDPEEEQMKQHCENYRLVI